MVSALNLLQIHPAGLANRRCGIECYLYDAMFGPKLQSERAEDCACDWRISASILPTWLSVSNLP